MLVQLDQAVIEQDPAPRHLSLVEAWPYIPEAPASDDPSPLSVALRGLGHPTMLTPQHRQARATSLPQVVDGYVRASPVDGRGSLTSWVQRRQIGRWVEANGWYLARTFVEHESMRSPRGRPALGEVLERVESGETDGLIVSRLSTLAESLDGAVRAIERVQAAGGVFVSVGDRVDLGTADGRLMLRVLSIALDLSTGPETTAMPHAVGDLTSTRRGAQTACVRPRG